MTPAPPIAMISDPTRSFVPGTTPRAAVVAVAMPPPFLARAHEPEVVDRAVRQHGTCPCTAGSRLARESATQAHALGERMFASRVGSAGAAPAAVGRWRLRLRTPGRPLKVNAHGVPRVTRLDSSQRTSTLRTCSAVTVHRCRWPAAESRYRPRPSTKPFETDLAK